MRAPRPAPGLGKGSIVYMAPDFDEPMEEFKEYMGCRPITKIHSTES